MPDRLVELLGKPTEYWVLMLAVCGYLMRASKDLPLAARATNTLISAALGYVFSESLSAVTFGDEKLALLVVMILGLFFLDIMTVIFRDREFWRTEGRQIAVDYLRRRLGVDKGGDNAD